MNSINLLNDILSIAKDKKSVYQLLRAYDYIIKQNKIQTNSELAMNLYAQIIKITSTKNPNIQDPEIMFSFSKKAASIKSEARPRNLFEYIQQKDNSEKINKKAFKNSNNKNIRIVSQFDATQVLKSNNYNHLVPQKEIGILYNDQQLIINKPVEEKQKLLKNVVKQKRITQFMMHLKSFAKQNRKNLKKKSSQYFYLCKQKQIVFKSLKTTLQMQKRRLQQINAILDARNQDKLEEYFLQWKTYTFRTETQKQYQQIIQQKSSLISKRHFLFSLKARKQQKKQNSLDRRVQQLYQFIGLSRLKIFHLTKIEQKNKTTQLKINLKRNQNKIFYKLLKCFIETLQRKQHKKIKQCQLFFGRKFFKKMSNEFQFNEVYWKKKQKIIFLYMIFNQVKKNLQQSGYFLHSLKNLDKVMLQSPGRHYLQKWKQQRVFQGLKLIVSELKLKKSEIFQLHCKRIMQKLKLFHRLNNKQFKISRKTKELSQIIIYNKGKALLENLSHKNILQAKANILQSFTIKRKCQSFLYYLFSYKLTKDFYLKNFQQFIQNNRHRKLFVYFQAMKNQIKRQKKLKALLNAFTKLKQNRITSKVFKIIKSYEQSQKIHNVKVNNLKKSRFSYNCEFFWREFKRAHRQCSTQTIICLQQKSRHLKNVRLQRFLKKIVQSINYTKTQKQINHKIIEQVRLITKWKIFKALVQNKNYNQIQKQKINKIQALRNKRIKQQFFEKLVNSLTISLYFTQANHLAIKCILRYALEKIQQY